MKCVVLILCVIFFQVSEVENQNMSLFLKDVTTEPEISRIFSRLLRKYKKFEIIFHTESKYVEHVGKVIHYFTYNHSDVTDFLIYNHDKSISDNLFVRPNVSQTVNFLFSNKTEIWKSLAVPEKIQYRDVVIFVTMGNGSVQRTVNTEGIDFIKLAGKVLLLEIIPHHGVSFFDICYYCGSRSMKLYFFEKTHNSHLKTKKSRFMPNNFLNLRGHKLKVVFIPYFPYINCDIHSKNTLEDTTLCINVQGIENELLKIISKKLNFTYDVHVMNSNASFMDMIHYIKDRKADIAFGGISMTIDRIPLVQFSRQYNSEEFTFLYLFNIGIQEVFIKFIEPFNAIAVWTLYFIAFIMLSLLLNTALKLKTEFGTPKTTFSECVRTLFRVSMEQSTPYISRLFQKRLTTATCLGLWWWSCLILNTVYRSTILSSVVNPPSLEPENLEELMQAGYRFVGNAQFADIIKDLLFVPDPLYRKTLSQIVYGTDTCDVFERILQGSVAMLDEMSTIQYEIRTVCPAPSHSIIKWLRIGRTSIRATGHAWATQRGAPYRHSIDRYLSRVLSGGHFKKWTNDAIVDLRKDMIPMSRGAIYKKFRRLPVKRFLPILTIYISGMSISTVCFIIETIYDCTKHRRK